MALAIQLFRETDDRRAGERWPVSLDATVRTSSPNPMDAIIHDLSAQGFLVETETPLPVGEVIRAGMAGLGSNPARVIWQKDHLHGCAFVTPLVKADFEAALAAERVGPIAFPGREAPSIATLSTPRPLSARMRLLFIAGSSLLLWSAIASGVALLAH